MREIAIVTASKDPQLGWFIWKKEFLFWIWMHSFVKKKIENNVTENVGKAQKDG